MNAPVTHHFLDAFSRTRSSSEKERFRDKFQRAMRSCIRKGFTVEESFGMIWVETWEEIAINDEEQSLLYDELIRWAKSSLPRETRGINPVIHRSYSRTSVAA